MAQWCIEEAAAVALLELDAHTAPPGISEATAAHQRIIEAAKQGRLVT